MPHSEYIQKLRKGVKGSPAVAAFNLHANARRATDEAHQLMAAGGIVTSVDDAAELEKVEYWQQGDASLATKEKMEARQALRHHKVVLEALQMYWEAAQRSLHSGGDPSANELHQEGHALMLRRIYRVMIKDFDPDECERSIAEDWARDTKGKETLSRKLFCDAFFELADTWTAGIDAHEYAAFLKVLFGTVTVKKPVVGADGQLIMVSFVWKDEVDCVFDEAYAEEVEALAVPIAVTDALLQQHPSWMQFVLSTYRRRFEETLETLDAIAFRSLDERLAHYLGRAFEARGTDELRLTHAEIATDLNSSREVISRLLKRMEQDGSVALGRHSIHRGTLGRAGR